MKYDGIVLSDDEYRTLLALGEIAECAFGGYPENRGAEQEKQLAITFTWFVRDFCELIKVSHENLDDLMQEYEENLKEKLTKRN